MDKFLSFHLAQVQMIFRVLYPVSRRESHCHQKNTILFWFTFALLHESSVLRVHHLCNVRKKLPAELPQTAPPIQCD